MILRFYMKGVKGPKLLFGVDGIVRVSYEKGYLHYCYKNEDWESVSRLSYDYFTLDMEL